MIRRNRKLFRSPGSFPDHTHRAGVHPYRTVGFLPLALLLLSLTALSARAQIPCGGEGQKACLAETDAYGTPYLNVLYDTGTFAFTTFRLCDLALGIDPNTFLCNGNEPIGSRHIIGEYLGPGVPIGTAATPYWTAFAMQQQGIVQADQAINWTTIFGTHNSFSNYQDGAFNVSITLGNFNGNMSVDQYYSIFDQLVLGARYIRIDPLSYSVVGAPVIPTESLSDLRVCHQSADSSGATIAECNITARGRLFQYALKEVRDWLRTSPSEVLVLRMNRTVAGDYDQIDAAIAAEIGDVVLKPSDWRSPYDVGWPTSRQMRAMGKNIIILSDQARSKYAFPWGNGSPPGGGGLGSWVVYDGYTDYAPSSSTQYETAGQGFPQCYNLPAPGLSSGAYISPSIDVRTRSYYQWSYIGEDRSGSNSFNTAPGAGLLGSAAVAAAANCGFGIINVDFLAALDSAPVNSVKETFAGETILGQTIPPIQIFPGLTVPSITIPPVTVTIPAIAILGVTIVPETTITLEPGFTIPGYSIPAYSTPSFTIPTETIPSYTFPAFNYQEPNNGQPQPPPPSTTDAGPWGATVWPGKDARREGAIWSWDLGDLGAKGPAYVKAANGRWGSQPQTTSLPYACAVGAGNFTNPAGYTWFITSTAGPWWSGQGACQSAGGVFWAPQSAVEQQNLIKGIQATGKDVWINWVSNGGPAILEPVSAFLTGTPQADKPPANPPIQTFTLYLTQGQPAPPEPVFQYTGGMGGVLKFFYDSTNILGLSSANVSVNSPSKLVDLGPFSGITDANGNVNLAQGTHKMNFLVDEAFPTTNESVLNQLYVVVLPPGGTTLNNVGVTAGFGPQTSTYGIALYIDNVDTALPALFQPAGAWAPGTTHTLDGTKVNTLSPLPAGQQLSFVSWSDGGAAKHTITAPSQTVQFTGTFGIANEVTVTQPANGSITLSPPGPYFLSQTPVTVTAAPNTGYAFTGFTGTAVGVNGFTAAGNPQTLTVGNSPVTLSGGFAIPSVTFSTNVSTSESNGANFIINNGSFGIPVTRNISAGTSVTVEAPATFPSATHPGIQYVFTGWIDGIATNTRTFVVNSSATQTFEAIYKEQVQVTVILSPSASGTVAGGGWADINSMATLTATPAAQYYFRGFVGPGFSGTANPYAVSVGTTPITVTAVFASNPEITVNTSPSNLSLLVDNAVVTVSQVYKDWAPGSTHTLDAHSAAAGIPGARSSSVSWAVNSSVASTQTSYTFTVPTTQTSITANIVLSYALQVKTNGPGKASVSPASPTGDGYYPAGTPVAITATPNPNSSFVNFTGALTGTANPGNLTMNALSTVTANFGAQQTTLTFTTNVAASEGSQITVAGVTHSNSASVAQGFAQGSSVNVSAPASFVSATNPGIQYIFQSWTNGPTTPSQTIAVPSSPTTYSAVYKTQYLITVQATPPSSGTVTGGGWVDSGSTPALTASAAAAYYFKDFKQGSSASTANPLQLASLTAPVSVTAEFAADPAITITSVPTGQIVYVDMAAVQTPQTFTWTPGAVHSLDASQHATANPGVHETFTSWADGSPASYKFTVPANTTTLTANFNLSYLLTLNAIGPGTVSALQASPTGDGFYPASAGVTVTASPNANSSFSGFSGDLSGVTNPQNIAMLAPHTVTATFAANTATQPTIAFTTNLNPPDGFMLGLNSMAYSTFPVSQQFAPGAILTVSVPAIFVSASNSGIQYVFQKWSDGVATAARSIAVPSASTTYQAIYKTQEMVTTQVTPAGAGTVSGGGWADSGSSPSLSAKPASGYYFLDFKWSGANTTSNPAPVTVTAPLTVTAEFAADPAITLTSNPAGSILYVDNVQVATPQTFTWAPGTTHSLDASHTATGTAGAHQNFANWSDGGLALHTFTVPASGAPITLTANFNLSYLLTLASSGPGSLSASPLSPTGDGYYPAGSGVSVTFTPQTGSYLSLTGGALNGAASPQTITMTGPLSGSAVFAADPVTTIQSSLTNSAAAIDGILTSLPAQLQWTPGSNHTVAFASPVAGSAGQQFAFSGWSDGAAANPRQIVAGAAATAYTGNFTAQYLLTATVSPSSGGVVTGGGWYNAGAVATVSAAASGGYEFSGFSGAISAQSSPQTVTVTGPMSVTAGFVPASPRITVSASVIDDHDPNTVQLGLVLNNQGAGTAGSLTVDSATFQDLTGDGTVGVAGLPLIITSLPGGQSVTLPVSISWPASATRIRLTIHFTADKGTYQGSQILNLFR
jgi:hypothetical protein